MLRAVHLARCGFVPERPVDRRRILIFVAMDHATSIRGAVLQAVRHLCKDKHR